MDAPSSPSLPALRDGPGGALLAIRVSPKSAREGLAELDAARIRVRVGAPAAEDRANRAVVRLLSRIVGWPAGRIRIVAGRRSRQKTVEFIGARAAELARRLEEAGR